MLGTNVMPTMYKEVQDGLKCNIYWLVYRVTKVLTAWELDSGYKVGSGSSKRCSYCKSNLVFAYKR